MLPIPRRSLVDEAIEQFREQIDNGSWPVGQRLPAEAKLAEELGMSRASVREATRALVHAGLLSSRQWDGTFVIATDESDVALRRRLGAADEGDEATFVQADIDFHVGLADAAHNRTLREMYRSFSAVISSTVDLNDCYIPGSIELAHDHERLLDGIRTKKALDDKLEGELKSALEAFTSTFA